jgi:hypothetical protein
MQQTDPKSWQTLCKAAAVESDPNKLMDLVSEIIDALDELGAGASRPPVDLRVARPGSFSDSYDGA